MCFFQPILTGDASKLLDIYYEGTIAEWKNIDVTYCKLPKLCVIHCSDGDIKPVIQSMSLTPPEKKEYAVGEELDLTGGSIYVLYDDLSHETINLTPDMVTGFNNKKSGTQKLTVKYGDKTATFTVTVSGSSTPTPEPVKDTVKIGANGDYKTFKEYVKALGKTGEKGKTYTIDIGDSLEEKTITLPKDFGFVITGGTLTTNTITANSPLVLDDVTLAGVKNDKPTNITAKSDLTLSGGTYGNITVNGKADISNITVNGNLAFKAKADKSGELTDTLENVTVTKKLTSNNNLVLNNCPTIGSVSANNIVADGCGSIGTVTAKGTVTVEGDGTKADSITAKAKSGTTALENVTVAKKITVSHDLTISGESSIGGKIAVSKGTLELNGFITAKDISAMAIRSEYSADVTLISLAVTKHGNSTSVEPITLTIVDKKTGSNVKFTPGDKKAVAVKTFKGEFLSDMLLISEENCSGAKLDLQKNKLYVVSA